MTSATDNRTTELRISEPLRGFIRHQSNRAYIDGGQARWLTEIADKIYEKHEQAIAATLGSEREAELVRAMEDVLRHSTDTVWVSEIETLVDRMVSLGVYGCEVYEGARPWEVD